jgi:DNA topoisomerase-3
MSGSYKLVIAEKPSVAREIGVAMCGSSKDARLPISGNGYMVTACAGHLIELKDPGLIDERFYDRYDESLLPISFAPWPSHVALTNAVNDLDRRGDHSDKANGVRKKQKRNVDAVNAIGKLLKDADCVIGAGDADDEGQLIVDEVLEFLDWHGDTKRVYVNNGVPEEVRKAFGAMRDNEDCKGVGRAAFARSVADFCFGINESRLAGCRLHMNAPVGRVKAPTLGLVVTRDRAVEGHVAQEYNELDITVALGGADIPENAPENVVLRYKPSKSLLSDSKHLAGQLFKDARENVLKRLTDGKFSVVVAENRKTKAPALPYNLTELQKDMSKRFKLTPQATMEITQSLREKYQCITYNRTDSRYLPEAMFTDAGAVLGTAMRNVNDSKLAAWPLDFTIKSEAYNDANVTAHHAIIPTSAEVDVSHMSADEQKVYTSVVERYALQFLPPYIYDESKAVLDLGELGSAEVTARRTIDDGYRKWAGKDIGTDDEAKDKETPSCPFVPEGTYDGCTYVSDDVKVCQTKPPAYYTNDTLLADMSSISKYCTGDVRKILKRKDKDKKGESGGIGTVATRAQIIEDLKAVKWLTQDAKGHVRSTEFGRQFYDAMPEDIRGADTTGYWWLRQQQIAEGKSDAYDLEQDVIDTFNDHKDTAYVGAVVTKGTTGKTIGVCPRCESPVVLKGSKYTCSSNHFTKGDDGKWSRDAGCGFEFWQSVCGKKLTDKQAAQLIGKGVTSSKVSGLKNKQGKTFSARLRLGDDLRVTFVFDDKK